MHIDSRHTYKMSGFSFYDSYVQTISNLLRLIRPPIILSRYKFSMESLPQRDPIETSSTKQSSVSSSDRSPKCANRIKRRAHIWPYKGVYVRVSVGSRSRSRSLGVRSRRSIETQRGKGRRRATRTGERRSRCKRKGLEEDGSWMECASAEPCVCVGFRIVYQCA